MKRSIVVILIIYISLAWASQAVQGSTGKILFTSTRLSDVNSGKVAGKNTFGLLDDLYVYAGLHKTLAEYYDSLNMDYDFNDPGLKFNYALRIYIDGKQEARWLFEMPLDDFRHLKRVEFVLNTSDTEGERRYGYTEDLWKHLVSDLEGGSHNIEVELVPLNKYSLDAEVPVLARGSMQLRVDPDQMADFTREPAHILPEPTLISKIWEDQIVRASEDVFPHLVPVRAIITDVKGHWSYGSDESGNIIRRYIVATVLFRNTMIGDCEIRSSVYYQNHEGEGVFGKAFFLKPATGYFENTVPCDLAEGGDHNR